MRLSHIEVFGFKSFAQKVQIPFGPGITAIVGPNGCGKSNVVEAIRWVLGEQRATAFRSHRMDEVVFAGTRNRKPLGMAEVVLTIENTNNILPVDYSEVTLARRLFRSGDSDYLLNKMPCRLLDIQNLLMDTGLGQGAYAVMEQGMVDEIISEKTDNRRRILEEAAGITKYKLRRRATWSKLESTNADLTRLADIIAEVKRQVEYLGRQVGRARRYKEMKSELDELEVKMGRLRYFDARQELDPLEQEFGRLRNEAEEHSTRFTVRETELEKTRLALTQAEKALQDLGVEMNKCVEEIHDRDRKLVASRERREAADQFIVRAGREKEEHAQQIESAEKQLAETRDQLTNSDAEAERLRQRLDAASRDAAEAEAEFGRSQSMLEETRSQRLELVRKQGELNSAHERLSAEDSGLEQQLVRLNSDLGEIQTRRSGIAKDEHVARDKAAEFDRQLTHLNEQRNEVQQRVSQAEQHERLLRDKHAEIAKTIEANDASRVVLEKVRSGFEGYSSGVRTLMLEWKGRDLFRGVLGDIIDVDPAYRRAVEVALGDALEALIADDADGVLDAIHHLKNNHGRAGVLLLGGNRGEENTEDLSGMPGVVGPLREFVRGDSTLAPLLSSLLRNTFLVEDLQTLFRLVPDLAAKGVVLVTTEGDLYDLSGRIAGGTTGSQDESVLGRREQIQELRANVARDRARLATVEGELQAEESRQRVLQERSTQMTSEVEQLRERQREQLQAMELCQQERQQLEVSESRLRTTLAEIDARRQTLLEALDSQAQKVAHIDRDAAGLEDRLLSGQEVMQRIESIHQQSVRTLSALRVEEVRQTEKIAGMKRDQERLQHIRANLKQNFTRLATEMADAQVRQRTYGQQEDEITAELKVMHQQRDVLHQEQDKRRQNWSDVQMQMRKLEEHIGKLQRELNAQRERRHKLELEISELKLRAEQIRTTLQEDHSCDVDFLGPFEDEGFDPGRGEQRLQQLRNSIQRLGTVHVGVLEDYDEQKERYEFLCQQRDDLTAAAEDLRRTLSLIDRTARTIFRETFQQIREKFRETFARFFPGGEADLQLEADTDPLESNIEIIARPRGKRLQSIALLSGGERALTAISLLFALYLVRPSPFCILDEVDAPLDDANIGRFVHVLKEFARTTQFIMVTHNKISMHAADALHGVTMPEEGVSQLVSVQIGDELMNEAAG